MIGMATSDQDGHLAELRRHLASEQQRLVELRKRAEEAKQRAATLKARMIRNRLDTAAQAEVVADQAEAFAAQLEAEAGGRGDGRRLRLAEREREIAAIECRNAARLRQDGSGPLGLEAPPRLDDEGGEEPPQPSRSGADAESPPRDPSE